MEKNFLKYFWSGFLVCAMISALLFYFIYEKEQVFVENPINSVLIEELDQLMHEIDSIQEINVRDSVAYAKLAIEHAKAKEDLKFLTQRKYAKIQSVEPLNADQLYQFCATIRQRRFR